ncbi:MAG TPA: Hpt domain-containing protein [Thermoanaerobaculia bacterium]
MNGTIDAAILNGTIDAAILESLRPLGDAFLKELFQTYSGYAREQLELLRGALAAADGTAFCRRLHALRGASLGVGAAGVASACRTAEDALAFPRSIPRRRQLEAIESELGRALAALAEISGGLRP